MFDGNNDIPENKSFHDSDTCALYGKIVKNDASIEETVGGERYLFDSQHCITIFKKLANLYGQEFKSISVGEQYVYDSNLKRYVLGEHELDTIKKEAEKIENQVFKS